MHTTITSPSAWWASLPPSSPKAAETKWSILRSGWWGWASSSGSALSPCSSRGWAVWKSSLSLKYFFLSNKTQSLHWGNGLGQFMVRNCHQWVCTYAISGIALPFLSKHVLVVLDEAQRTLSAKMMIKHYGHTQLISCLALILRALLTHKLRHLLAQGDFPLCAEFLYHCSDDLLLWKPQCMKSYPGKKQKD